VKYPALSVPELQAGTSISILIWVPINVLVTTQLKLPVLVVIPICSPSIGEPFSKYTLTGELAGIFGMIVQVIVTVLPTCQLSPLCGDVMVIEYMGD
jgi:hypothetical protein